MADEHQRTILELELLNIETQLSILKSLQRICRSRSQLVPQRKKKKEKVRARQRRRRLKQENVGLVRAEKGEYCQVSRALNEKDNEMLFSYFHMSAERFVDLVDRLKPFIKLQCPHTTDVRQKVAITLRFLASGESQKNFATAHKLVPSTLSTIVTEVCRALWTTLERDFLPCLTADKWEGIRSDFWQQLIFPNCVGSLAGKLVNVKAPPGTSSPESKDAPPIALIATCDARYRFTTMEVETCQQESDGDIFKNSTLGSKLLDGNLDLPQPVSLADIGVSTPNVFVADAAFPLHNNLMHPFQGVNLSMEKQAYNFHHFRVVRVMENTFGILVARWRILSRSLEFMPDEAMSVLKACIVLHNFLASNNDNSPPGLKYIPANFADTDTAGSTQPGEWRTVVTGDSNLFDPVGPQRLARSNSKCNGVGVRNKLMNFFHSLHEASPL